MRPVILCAHGTDSAAGQQVVHDLLVGVRAARPGWRVEAAYVDVQRPSLEETVVALHAQGEPPVIIPLLLSTGFHVQVDIARAVATYPGTESAGQLGPGARLAAVLVERLLAVGATPADRVVLAVAGSSRLEATRDAERMLDLVRARWSGPVRLAYGAAAAPDVPSAVRAARGGPGGKPDAGTRVIVAAYLLGPGFFHDLLGRSGADLVTAPLGAHPLVIEQILARAAPWTGPEGSGVA